MDDDQTGTAAVEWEDTDDVPQASAADAEFDDADEGTVAGTPVRSLYGSERDGQVC